VKLLQLMDDRLKPFVCLEPGCDQVCCQCQLALCFFEHIYQHKYVSHRLVTFFNKCKSLHTTTNKAVIYIRDEFTLEVPIEVIVQYRVPNSCSMHFSHAVTVRTFCIKSTQFLLTCYVSIVFARWYQCAPSCKY